MSIQNLKYDTNQWWYDLNFTPPPPPMSTQYYQYLYNQHLKNGKFFELTNSFYNVSMKLIIKELCVF